MKTNLPLGYWLKDETDDYICIGFQHGGHMGGECDIYIPRKKLDKFCNDKNWRQKTINKFSKIVFLAAPELKVPIPKSETLKDGIVPKSWN